MQSFENMPTSPSKRLGVSLNLDTGYKGKGKEISPPQTPVAQTSRPSRGNIGPTNRALKVRAGPRETFLDDITPIDPGSNKENAPERGRPFRDSHDLELSPRQVTRDSLVDHMLLSLDQFSFGQEGDGFGPRQPTVDEERLYSSFADEESYQPAQNFAPRNGRGHNYSYSSDYDNGDDSSRYSGQLSRERRSNSSSNFQSSLGRINSIRNDPAPNPGYSGSRAGSKGPPPPIQTRGLHSRSGKGSKGSSANSFDLGYAQVTSNQRWAHGLAGRSSSFDFGSDRQSLNAHSNPMDRPMNTSVAAFSPYDYDAAPTPTVPGGPRRPRPASPLHIPQPDPVQTERAPQKLERKRSSRSSKSAYKGKSSNVLSGGRLDYELHDRTRELPPLPAFIKEPAPAPLVGYGKAKEQSPQVTPQPPKEKQGFFRRVFGSSKNHSATVPEPPSSHGSTASAEIGDRPGSKTHHIANQIKSQHAPPRESPPATKEHAHVLTKKPSSFFRRRKKSVSEADPVPVVPPIMLQPEKEAAVGKPEPSPVSSLRKVMNPYLDTPQRSPLDPYPQNSIDRQMNNSPEAIDRTVRGFSPDYEPDKSATIRAIKSSSRDAVDSMPSSHASAQKPFLGGLDGQSRDDGDATFLQDSSDNDRDGHSADSRSVTVTVDAPTTTWLGSTKPSSPAVARDMALVAEYERIHSKRSPTAAKFELAKSSPSAESQRSPTESKSNVKKTLVTLKQKEDEWVMLTPTKSATPVEVENRVWLEPSSSEEDVTLQIPPKLGEVSGRTSASTDTAYKSATSLPIVQIDGSEDDDEPAGRRYMTAADALKSLDDIAPATDDQTPAKGDRERAKKIYDGNEDFIQKEKAAAWMGEEGPSRLKTLIAYMELYDFANLNILAALRMLCGRLVLKAESQQVDRILDAFAKRWCQCNPNHGFKVTGM